MEPAPPRTPHLRCLAYLLIGGLLVLGTIIFKDYGIHWDEYRNQHFGQRTARRIGALLHLHGAEPIAKPREHDFTHGPLFELMLQGAERFSGLQDSRHVILLRHYVTFWSYVMGVLGFWLLCLFVFERHSWALLGCVLLIAHPRIFAHAFYNSVDIPFLAVFVWSCLTLLRLLERPSPQSALIHALLSGFLIDLRLFGGILAVITLWSGLIDVIARRHDRAHVRSLLSALALYAPVCLCISVMFWPLLWSDPWRNLQWALALSRNAGIPASPLDIAAWLDTPAAILYTTPLLSIVLFCIGAAAACLHILRPRTPSAGGGQFAPETRDSCVTLGSQRGPAGWRDRRNVLILGMALILPIAVPPLLGTRLQDGWRHHFFIFPLIVVFALYGMRTIWEKAAGLASAALGRSLRAVLVLALLLSISATIAFMIRHHPFQFVYGSEVSGVGHYRARFDCTLDEWGVSYRAALERILRSDTRPLIRVHFANRPGINSPRILPESLRRRLEVVESKHETDYYLSNLRGNCTGQARIGDEWFALSVDGAKFMVVNRVTRRGPVSGN